MVRVPCVHINAKLACYGAAREALNLRELMEEKTMDRREFLAAAGTVAAAATASQAFAQTGEEPMHPPKYKALEEAASHCVATGNDCLRHCLGMYAMKDTSMAGCADAAYQARRRLRCSAGPRRGQFSACGGRRQGRRTDLQGLPDGMRKVPQCCRMQSLWRVL